VHISGLQAVLMVISHSPFNRFICRSVVINTVDTVNPGTLLYLSKALLSCSTKRIYAVVKTFNGSLVAFNFFFILQPTLR
jgi:hypothetical protein